MLSSVDVVECKANSRSVASLVCVSVHRSMPDRRCRGVKGKWCCIGEGCFENANIIARARQK